MKRVKTESDKGIKLILREQENGLYTLISDKIRVKNINKDSKEFIEYRNNGALVSRLSDDLMKQIKEA